ncbi:MAG: PTS sugar transporter subunit IIA [Phycisphaerae bacterium]|nr:PTS sugar transporter subunit IIA [Phycisphaerae bacterium]
MPHRNFTLADLARYLGMDARELERWAERGQIPAMKVGGEWRFNGAATLEWAQRELPNLDERHIREMERAMSGGDEGIIVGRLLHAGGVEPNLAARSPESVLRELVALAEKTELLYDPKGLFEALREREQMCSTALPGGIALPHPRRPMPYAFAEPFVCFARVIAGVPFSAPDGELTDLFVLVCCAEERQHLTVLARLALMFHTTPLIRQLREIESAAEAEGLIRSAEETALKHRR